MKGFVDGEREVREPWAGIPWSPLGYSQLPSVLPEKHTVSSLSLSIWQQSVWLSAWNMEPLLPVPKLLV